MTTDALHAVLIITCDMENAYAEQQFRSAQALIRKSRGFLEVTEAVFIIETRLAFPTLATLYAQECRRQEFRLRFAVVPCSPTVFGAFLEVEAKALADFGLQHWETAIPAAQPLR